ncbi:MAG TPA: hypothetical protein VFV47_01080 [Hyphomicrobiaceae bacterium]|nr:hypothetical protein [Hyphomicrobiaceae bacterium]
MATASGHSGETVRAGHGPLHVGTPAMIRLAEVGQHPGTNWGLSPIAGLSATAQLVTRIVSPPGVHPASTVPATR